MKLTNLFENENENEETGEITIADVFFEKDKFEREGFKMMKNIESLAPAGEIRDSWQGNLKLVDLPITSLKGFPKKVTGDIDLNRLNINSLEGIGAADSMSLSGLNIKNFKGISNPKWLSVSYCVLDDLTGLPANLQSLTIGHCILKTFEGFPGFVANFKMYGRLNHGEQSSQITFKNIDKFIKAAGVLAFEDVDVDEDTPLLGFLKIEQLKQVVYSAPYEKSNLKSIEQALEIVNKFLPNGDIFECQDALIDAGFEKHAKL